MDSTKSPGRGSTAGGAPTSAASTSRIPPSERNPRTPPIPEWDGGKDPLPEPLYMPQFRNYQFRYAAYPGYRDAAKNPLWPDGAVKELARRQDSPYKSRVGRPGRLTFKRHERVVGDLQYAQNPKAKKAHEWVWYNMKDPDQFTLKPPRRWDPAGVKAIAPRPFHNRKDGHFLLNNSCTIVNLFLRPELRKLQCYFYPKLPKLPQKPNNLYLQVPKIGRAFTKWRWTAVWKMPLIHWYTNTGPEEPEIAEMKALERLLADKEHTQNYYRRWKEGIEKLRAIHRMPKQGPPPPPKVKIDYHLPVGKENLLGVRKVKELWEEPILNFWVNEIPDIMEIILSEEAEREVRNLAKAKAEEQPPPPIPSFCQTCEFH